MKTALVALDLQKDFFSDDNPNLVAFESIVPAINRAITSFRSHSDPIVFVQHTSKAKPVGSDAWKIHEAFDVQDDDLRVMKSHPDAFWKSSLDSELQAKAVEAILIVGVLSEHCVLSTYRGALLRGYRTLLLEEGIASLSNDLTGFTLRLCEHIGIDELDGLWA